MRTVVLLLLLSACHGARAETPRIPRRAQAFTAFGGVMGAAGQAEDAVLLPDGDIVVAGCQYGPLDLGTGIEAGEQWRTYGGSEQGWGTWIARIDRKTTKVGWVARSLSPCGLGDSWSVPRLAVAPSGTVWMAAAGWGQAAPRKGGAVVLASFDSTGLPGVSRELALGERVRAMVGLPGDRVAIAAQFIDSQARAQAFVMVVDASGAEVWRTQLPGSSSVLLDSIAVGPAGVLVGGTAEGKLDFLSEATPANDSVGFVVALAPDDGKLVSTWSRRHAGVHVGETVVATSGDDAFVALGLGVRPQSRWPDTLPPLPPGVTRPQQAIVVEPLRFTGAPAWRHLVTGDETVVTVGSLAVARGRVALVVDVQHGAIDVGQGPWKSAFFGLGAYVELSATGIRIRARRLTAAGNDTRVFLRRVLWDGGGFTVVGMARGQLETGASKFSAQSDAAFVWRIDTD